MPIELSDSLKNTCGFNFVSRGMNRLFCSKFYTTLILTIIVLILITVIYPCQKGTPYWVVGKLGLYIFVGILVILFIHDGVLYSSIEKEVKGGLNDEFVRTIGGYNDDNIVFAGDSIRVEPAMNSVVNNNGASENVDNNPEEIFAMYGV